MQNSRLALHLKLRYLFILLFVMLSLASGLLKNMVVRKLDTNENLLASIDLIRSETSIYLAIIAVLLLISRKPKLNTKTISLFICFYLTLLSFFILKLATLYSYTRDATPFSALAYGAYLYDLDFLNADVAFFVFSICTPLGFLILWGLSFGSDLSSSSPQGLKSRLKIHLLIAVCIVLAFIPPQQKFITHSLSYNPFIFTLVSSYKPAIEDTPIASNFTEPLQADKDNNGPSKRNLVFIILESIRADAINTLGDTTSLSPKLEVSPNISSLSKNSIIANSAYALIPHTSKALVVIHCGTVPYLKEYLLESSLGIPADCLAKKLKASGYRSVFFQSPTNSFENRTELVQALSFDEFYSLEDMPREGFEIVNYFGYEDDIMLSSNQSWLSEISQTNRDGTKQPFIATYLTGTSHHNYNVPKNFEIQSFSSKKKLNRYLNAVHYVDRFVGKVIAQYKAAGLYENTVFILVGDHGEGFGEHRPLLHNNNLYNDGLKIPLIIHNSQLSRFETNQNLSQVNLLDIAMHFITSKTLQADDIENLVSDQALFASCWYSDYCYALIGKQKLGQDQDASYKYLINMADNSEELFNLSKDPLEKVNLAASLPQLTQQLKSKILEIRQAQNSRYDKFYFSQEPSKTFKDSAIKKSFSKLNLQ